MSKLDKSPARTIYVCQQCGKESLKWLGRCPDCQQWNSFVETVVATTVASPRLPSQVSPPQELSRVVIEATDRVPLPMAEFNRVLGGGFYTSDPQGGLRLSSRHTLAFARPNFPNQYGEEIHPASVYWMATSMPMLSTSFSR